ncbi:MAG: isoprenyl transferase [Elusimicrobiota bacterium]
MSVPAHVAIIMDGNGRWAKSKGFPRIIGHRYGMKRIKDVVKSADEAGVKILTLYAFSTENWKRPKNEVHGLMNLLEIYLKKEINELDKKNVRFRTIGDITALPNDIQQLINNSVKKTEKNTGLILNIALNYGGRSEIVSAVNKICKDRKKAVTEDEFADYLDTKGQADPDLLIRTGGDMRVSNFLLWQIAYSEIVFINKFWPDFKKQDFNSALKEYSSRERRFGSAKE